MGEKTTEYCDVKYMGGHVEYPKPSNCRLYFYNDRIELEDPNLIIPYESIFNIENMDQKKISAGRVVALGLVFLPLAIVGAMWKKNHLYTVIQYTESNNERTIIIDFEDIVELMQPFIYRRMARFKRSTSLISDNGFLSYENYDHGFRIKYPDSWYEDEINHKSDDYITVVEFRKAIEDKAPFVTIYINELNEKDNSAEKYISEGISQLESDDSATILERSDVLLGNNSGVRLVDIDKDGYQRMVYWIPSNDKVYEISYITKKEQYSDDLPIAERIMNSFRIVKESTKPSSGGMEKIQVSESTPLEILKKRFATGEITEEDYQRMKRILQEQ